MGTSFRTRDPTGMRMCGRGIHEKVYGERSLFDFGAIQTLRFTCLQRAGVIVHPDGYATLDAGRSPAVVARFRRLALLLDAA